MNNILLVFLGGGTGSIARYGMTRLVGRYTEGTSFPWHTLSVNLLGAFVIGVLVEVLALRAELTAPGKLLLITGFLGGFTTFSAFSLESALMLQKGDYVNLAAYIAFSVIGTIAAVFLGSGLMKSIL
jgi:CrcB protein